MAEDVKKKVDESWKQSVKQNTKTEPSPESPKPESPKPDVDESASLPEASFISLVTSLGMQAFANLGLIPQSQGGESKKDLKQAQYIIDLLAMLQEKTKGHLDDSEKGAVEHILYDLRMKFVEASRK